MIIKNVFAFLLIPIVYSAGYTLIKNLLCFSIFY